MRSVAIYTAVIFFSVGVQEVLGQASWWSLANVASSELSFRNGTLVPFACDVYRALLTQDQYLLCKVNAHIITVVVIGVKRAIHFCQYQFKDDCWNCPSFVGRFLLGQDVEATANREREYVRVLLSASITYDLAEYCREGLIPRCPSCVISGPFIRQIPGGIRLNQCGVDLSWAAGLTRYIVGYNTSDSLTRHNIDYGISLVEKPVEKCQRKVLFTSRKILTCHQGADPVLDTTNHSRVNAAKKVYTAGKEALSGNGQHFLFNSSSVNYCCDNNNQSLWNWTRGRECMPVGTPLLPDCYTLCCWWSYRQVQYYKTECVLTLVNGVPKLKCMRRMAIKYICN